MPSLRRDLAHGLALGAVWFTVLFASDTADSVYLLSRSTRRIKTDPDTIALLRDGVVDYVIGIVEAYMLLGVLAGVMMALALRLQFPKPPKRWVWWLTGLSFGAVITLVVYLHQTLMFPALYEWMPRRRWLCNNLLPMHIEGVMHMLGSAWLLQVAVRWQRAAPVEGRPLWRLAGLVGWLAGCWALLHTPAAGEPVDNTGTNVIFIGVDALRPDHLGFHGYERDTAPNIDAFLKESVVFESAWTPLGRTYPAWTSTLSGSLPIRHGIRDNLPENDALIPDEKLLSQRLQDAGYHTAFVTDDSRFSYMVPEGGWDTIVQPLVSVANFAVSVNEPRYRAFHALMHNPIGFWLVPVAAHNQSFGKSYRPDLFVERAADALADVSQNDQFFFALHSCVLHAPGDRPFPWYNMYDQKGYRGGNRFHYSRSGTELLVEDTTTGEEINVVSEQDVRIYDSGIDMADRLVGRIVGDLKASGLWDNSIVVLFSDHGEEHWAPDLPYNYAGPNHGFHPYGDGQFNVELAIHFPDGAHAGERVSDPVRLIDLAPTIADALGLDWPNEIDGLSTLPLIEGETEDTLRQVYIETGLSEGRYWPKGHKRYPFKKVSERYRVDVETGRVHIRPEFRPHLIAGKDRILQRGKYKLAWIAMRRGVRFHLFDREVDPYNRTDIKDREPLITAQLGLELMEYLEADGQNYADQRAEWEAVVANGGALPVDPADDAAPADPAAVPGE